MSLLGLLGAWPWWLFVGALAVSIVWLAFGRERYRPRHSGLPALPTSEVGIDPLSGVRHRVWVNPVSGERAYVDEPPLPAPSLPPVERPGLAAPHEVLAVPAPPPGGWAPAPGSPPPGGGAARPSPQAPPPMRWEPPPPPRGGWEPPTATSPPGPPGEPAQPPG